MKRLTKILAAVALCLFTLTQVHTNAYALDKVNTEEKGSLSLTFMPDGAAAENVSFFVYRVGDIDEYCKISPLPAYAQAEHIEELAEKDPDYMLLTPSLEKVIQEKGIEPSYSGLTDASGTLVINDVPVGLYLVRGETYSRDARNFCPVSYMVSMPVRDGEHYVYKANAEVKAYEAYDVISVSLIWKDISPNAHNSDIITVQLVGDGTLQDTVSLSTANGWAYEWQNLPVRSKWSVTAQGLPSGYTMEIQEEKGHFLLICDTVNKSSAQTLPQTGLLWWPVPFLLLCGLCLIAVGIAAGKRKHKDH